MNYQKRQKTSANEGMDSYSLKQGEVTKARIILRLEKKIPFTLKVDFHQESKTALISKTHL